MFLKSVPGNSYLTQKGYLSGEFLYWGFLTRGCCPGFYLMFFFPQATSYFVFGSQNSEGSRSSKQHMGNPQ